MDKPKLIALALIALVAAAIYFWPILENKQIRKENQSNPIFVGPPHQRN